MTYAIWLLKWKKNNVTKKVFFRWGVNPCRLLFYSLTCSHNQKNSLYDIKQGYYKVPYYLLYNSLNQSLKWLSWSFEIQTVSTNSNICLFWEPLKNHNMQLYAIGKSFFFKVWLLSMHLLYTVFGGSLLGFLIAFNYTYLIRLSSLLCGTILEK